jgi:uncharacterized protein YecE (DUF72 family)
MAVGTIRIGTCGFGFFTPGIGWQERYRSRLQAFSTLFAVGEIDRSFYALPRVPTARRWRREAVPTFEFTLKAWQAITHPAGSPTWRRGTRGSLSEAQRAAYGYFRPRAEVFAAWERTREVARALEARVCVFQSPAAFGYSGEHERNLREFFGRIEAGGLGLAWEPRGSWQDHPDRVRRICRDLRLIHVVDPLRRPPLSDHPVAYLRLHGLNRREYDYDYDYSPEEQAGLAAELKSLAGRHETVYCLFNNLQMVRNAQALAGLLEPR